MTKRREHGGGTIQQRGENKWRLRYRVNGRQLSATVQGSLGDARKKLRELLHTVDKGQHVPPDRMTLAEWIKHWLDTGAPGRRKKRAGRRTLERYAQLLNVHVVPNIGDRRLQQLPATAIDELYESLESKIAPRTLHHVHIVLGACLCAAVRKGLLSANPIDRAEKVPSPGEADHGQVLDEEELTRLVQGFRNSTLYPIVAVAAFTGARRNEILALRWSDLDQSEKTLRIERAMEETKAGGRTVKEPKTARGRRSIQIDDDLLALLLREREKHARLVAGVPDGAEVDLSLVKLPDGALMFPSMADDTLDLTRLRDAHAVTREFCRQARKRGFPKLRFHDLRGSHETALLDRGVPVHTVAARCGHDPATMLRSYAKRTRKADTSAAAVIGALSKGALT
jgi:integrase